MIAALRTEMRKVASTRAWWLNAMLMFGYMVLMAAIMAVSFVLSNRQVEQSGTAIDPGGLGEGGLTMSPPEIATTVYTLAVSLGYIFPALLGAFAVTGEFRHRTITPTLLAEPRRGLVLTAKLVAILPFALVVAVAGVAGSVLGGAATLAALGEPTMLAEPEVLRAVALSVVALSLWALVGVGFGSVLTNQVAAIVVLLAFTQFVEPLVRVLLAQFDATAEISKFLPGAAGEAIAGSSLYSSSGLAELLVPWQGAVVLLGYAVALVVIGRLTTFRRDIG